MLLLVKKYCSGASDCSNWCYRTVVPLLLSQRMINGGCQVQLCTHILRLALLWCEVWIVAASREDELSWLTGSLERQTICVKRYHKKYMSSCVGHFSHFSSNYTPTIISVECAGPSWSGLWCRFPVALSASIMTSQLFCGCVNLRMAHIHWKFSGQQDQFLKHLINERFTLTKSPHFFISI